MPFKKITSGKDKGKYAGPGGRVWSAKQVQAYHATDGFKRKSSRKKG